MSKYLDMDSKNLTLDDALNDADWGKQPKDYLRYVTLEFAILQSIADDYTSDETKRLMQVLALYYVDGIEPDYSTIESSAVKQAVRVTITGQQARIESEYLRHYRQYVTAVQKRERQEMQEAMSDTSTNLK